jgi:hypothetical protein
MGRMSKPEEIAKVAGVNEMAVTERTCRFHDDVDSEQT